MQGLRIAKELLASFVTKVLPIMAKLERVLRPHGKDMPQARLRLDSIPSADASPESGGESSKS